MLAFGGQLTLEVLSFGCALIKMIDQSSASLGFGSKDTLAMVLLLCIFGMLFALLISAVQGLQRDAHVPTLRLRASGAPPELTQRAGIVFHLFLSHITSGRPHRTQPRRSSGSCSAWSLESVSSSVRERTTARAPSVPTLRLR